MTQEIRVCDYIANFIFQKGVREVFMVSGGGMMFLTDGIAKHPELQAICCHNEQAVSYAALGYAKYNESLAAAYFTTGCGSTNGITGLLGAWQDNMPCLFVSGQSKRKETVRNSKVALRQLGVQEADIISAIEPFTKYSVMINNPNEIKFHLEKATFLAQNGRPGPVWLDIPLDVQGALINPEKLKEFSKSELELPYKTEPVNDEIELLNSLLTKSKRPIIIAGQGIRLAKDVNHFTKFVEKNNIPVVASRLGINILPSDHKNFIGRIGTKGDRAGNFAMQNADLIVAMGSRLAVSSTGHEYSLFAREAKVVVVDIDPIEHKKNTVQIDHFINADIKSLLNNMQELNIYQATSSWTNTCNKWKNQWPVYLEDYSKSEKGINLYHFTEKLSNLMGENAITVSDAGSSFYVMSQGIKLKDGDRYITAGAQADMGFGLPAAIGTCISSGKQMVLCVTGDGSFQMNMQELQTLKHYNLPVKVFIWNNDGYLSIRASQRKFFNSRFIGTDNTSGVSFPDIKKLAYAFDLPYFKSDSVNNLDETIQNTMNTPGPVLCEIMCIRDQEIIPAVSSFKKDNGEMVSKPLEDMYPFLDRKEFLENMIVKPLDE